MAKRETWWRTYTDNSAKRWFTSKYPVKPMKRSSTRTGKVAPYDTAISKLLQRHKRIRCSRFFHFRLCAHSSTTADNGSFVSASVTHFVETNIWTAKSETKINATQLREWCSPFTSDTRNCSANTRRVKNGWNDREGVHLELKVYLSLQAHVIEHECAAVELL